MTAEWKTFRDQVVDIQHRFRTKQADLERLASTDWEKTTPERFAAARRAAEVTASDFRDMVAIIDAASSTANVMRDLAAQREHHEGRAAALAREVTTLATVHAHALKALERAKHVNASTKTIAGGMALVPVNDLNAVSRAAELAANLMVPGPELSKFMGDIKMAVNRSMGEGGTCPWRDCEGESEHVDGCPFGS